MGSILPLKLECVDVQRPTYPGDNEIVDDQEPLWIYQRVAPWWAYNMQQGHQ